MPQTLFKNCNPGSQRASAGKRRRETNYVCGAADIARRIPEPVTTVDGRSLDMSEVRLVFARTETDGVTNTWTAIKTVEVDLPFENAVGNPEQWQLIGAEWRGVKEENKCAQS